MPTLALRGAKPFCLIAGQYDDADSGALCCGAGYERVRRLELIHQVAAKPPHQKRQRPDIVWIGI